MNHKQIAYALLRVTLGVVFLFYGVGKFAAGRATITGGIVREFEKTPLPRGLVGIFAGALPFAEVGLGLCVLLGLFTTIALGLTAALLVALTLGQVLLLNGQIVANNLIYSVIVFLLLFFAEHNAFSLDEVWKRMARSSGRLGFHR